MTDERTICAVSTPAGSGGIALIRISGPRAIEFGSKVFFPKKKNAVLSHQPSNEMCYGEIRHRGQLIDDGMAVVFRAPHSYTGEDSVEITCHGSIYIQNQLLQALLAEGCSYARPGEYTQRAFLNGKMDLSQAEAVADLIASTNRSTHDISLSQLRGGFSSELHALRDHLLHLTSLLELELDFSDHEDLEFADRTELIELAKTIDQKVVRLSSSFQAGNTLKNGVEVAIVGKTNVGKSTLLNQLVHEDRAIVSDIHGTTRDVIEESVNIKGVRFRFLDTAGLRETTDAIEQIGIERTYSKLKEASIILWIVDELPTKAEADEMHRMAAGRTLITVYNKMDVRDDIHSQDMAAFTSETERPTLNISAKLGTNLQQLEDILYDAANIPEISEHSVIVTNARHYDALERAHQSLQDVIASLQQNISGDLVAEHLKEVLAVLAEITGQSILPTDTLSHIFEQFCIGK